jgi:lipoate-protein ligase A
MHLVLLPSAFGTAVENMAVDTTLLQTVPQKYALFRHYGWTEPSLTFGYTQRYKEVSSQTPSGACLGRRPTAGGIVDHRNDWTYSLILHAEIPAAKRPLTDIYSGIHISLQNALQEIDIQSHLAPCPKQCTMDNPTPEDSPHCFVKPVADDLLNPENGAKIAGAAIKRSRHGTLLQGSIDRSALPAEFPTTLFAKHFTQAIAKKLSLTIHELPDLRPLFQQPLLDDTRNLYAKREWLQKR